MATPELTRVFGQHGLYLRPIGGGPAELSGNMLANVLCLHREGSGLAGQLRCMDAELPICTGSLSLVYCLFMLESSTEPAALLREIARILKPEGMALVISLNPWSLAQLRWLAPARVSSMSSVERHANAAGLEVVRRQYLGPFWPKARSTVTDSGRSPWIDRFRAAGMLVLRHREAGLTPLRKAASAVSLRPGMSTG